MINGHVQNFHLFFFEKTIGLISQSTSLKQKIAKRKTTYRLNWKKSFPIFVGLSGGYFGFRLKFFYSIIYAALSTHKIIFEERVSWMSGQRTQNELDQRKNFCFKRAKFCSHAEVFVTISSRYFLTTTETYLQMKNIEKQNSELDKILSKQMF